jgi:hypothetical protein
MPNPGVIVVFGLSKINCLLGARFGSLKDNAPRDFPKRIHP